jgi:hypothetical protein
MRETLTLEFRFTLWNFLRNNFLKTYEPGKLFDVQVMRSNHYNFQPEKLKKAQLLYI